MTFEAFLLYDLSMKKIFFILLTFFIMLPASALMLQGNAEFNAELARDEVFNGVNFILKPSTFQPHWVDANYLSNYNALQNGKNKVADRYLALFSDGTYGLRYADDPYHNYYYDAEGVLFKVDVLNKPYDEYPHRSVAYNKYGVFKNATFVLSKREQYLYDVNKKLIGHWIENACYDSKGNVLLLRKNAN